MNSTLCVCLGVALPFIGTSMGALPAFFVSKLNEKIQSITLGLAVGVMLAASVWSLLIPAFELSSSKPLFLSPTLGYFIGVLMMLFIDKIPNKHIDEQAQKSKKMIFAITVHNVPEGMAVGIAFVGAICGSVSFASALILAIGIAVQNLPEGAIVSLPLVASGTSKLKAVSLAMLSAVAETCGSFLAFMLTSCVSRMMPFSLAFAAGAMHWVTFKELIPDSKDCLSAIFACIGFALMMILDIVLG